MPATVEGLRTHLGQDPATTVDEAAMQMAVDAANAAALRYALPTPVGDVWTADVDLGALLVSARLYGRRGSVQGVAAFGDIAVATIVRLDPDVRFLWHMAEYQDPVVA